MSSARSWYFALTLPAPVANKVLLLLGNVDLQIGTAEGLVFCPSGPNDSDFMIDNEGKLWAIYFGLRAGPGIRTDGGPGRGCGKQSASYRPLCQAMFRSYACKYYVYSCYLP